MYLVRGPSEQFLPQVCAYVANCADVRIVIAGVYLPFVGVAAAQQAAVAELYGHTVLIGRMLLVLDADSDDEVGIGTIPVPFGCVCFVGVAPSLHPRCAASPSTEDLSAASSTDDVGLGTAPGTPRTMHCCANRAAQV